MRCLCVLVSEGFGLNGGLLFVLGAPRRRGLSSGWVRVRVGGVKIGLGRRTFVICKRKTHARTHTKKQPKNL